MEDEYKKRIESLELEVSKLGEKINELVTCMADNNLSRKVPVDYVYPEEEEGEEEEVEDEAEEEVEEEVDEEEVHVSTD